jgi:hypothetical protein
VNVSPRLFTREEIVPVPANSEDRRAHGQRIRRSRCSEGGTTAGPVTCLNRPTGSGRIAGPCAGSDGARARSGVARRRGRGFLSIVGPSGAGNPPCCACWRGCCDRARARYGSRRISPLVVALVLGSMMEKTLRQSLFLSRGSVLELVSRPLTTKRCCCWARSPCSPAAHRARPPPRGGFSRPGGVTLLRHG